MTPPLRLALAQFDFPVGDVVGNTERIIAFVSEARDIHGALAAGCRKDSRIVQVPRSSPWHAPMVRASSLAMRCR
ncbi:MAG: hypothetical protein EON93_05585, partial [Burkholderiales bacterium]